MIKEAESAHGAAFLPVLRSQADTIDDFVDERYGKLRSVSSRARADPAGWAGGRVAADRAKLAFGDLGRTGVSRSNAHLTRRTRRSP